MPNDTTQTEKNLESTEFNTDEDMPLDYEDLQSDSSSKTFKIGRAHV